VVVVLLARRRVMRGVGRLKYSTKMKNYFGEEEYFIDHIWFHNGECRHDGNGILTWNPATGFHLAAHVKRNKPLPLRKDFKTIDVQKKILDPADKNATRVANC
jgi:hypothetical protein